MNSGNENGEPGDGGLPAAKAYLSRIEAYAERIRDCTEVDQIVALLDEALRETLSLGANEEFRSAHARVADAQRQIATLKAELQQATDLMLVDQLTGALNRRGLDHAFVRELSRCDRHGVPMSLAVLDLDDFKLVNDRYGHPFGDEALAQFAEVIRVSLRPSDIIARYGGEEFVVIFPHSDPLAARNALARVQRALAALPVQRNGDSVTLTFSAGLAGRRPREAKEALISRADAALLTAKRNGKNGVVLAPE